MRLCIPVLVAMAVGTAAAGCADDDSAREATASAGIDSAASAGHARRDTAEAAGEVVADTTSGAPGTVKWISDANILSLLGVLNARAISAADVELQAWHSDTVRAFAAAVARDHADLQHSVDSLAQHIRLAPVAPALAGRMDTTLKLQVDSLAGLRGPQLDRAFVGLEVASHQQMAAYIDEMSAVAERPEVQALLASAATRVGMDLGRARGLQAMLGAADSITAAAAADSAARRAAKHKRTTQ